jgi:hypothetical protein
MEGWWTNASAPGSAIISQISYLKLTLTKLIFGVGEEKKHTSLDNTVAAQILPKPTVLSQIMSKMIYA